MRYLGNKDSVLHEIFELLFVNNLLNEKLVFFDCFCGTGAVADFCKEYYDNIKINDNMKWAVTYASGRINSMNCTFEKLGFDPFEYLNSTKKKLKGFIYKTYSPGDSDRMYFTAENAGRIDYFRWQIEEWKKGDLISHDEYNYLLACLIESVSSVSNTAGVYGAFLKKWDSRAEKSIVFSKVVAKNDCCKNFESFNEKIENIIENVDCDVLYIDPPYTQNQYGTQYHLLETLVLNDNPKVSKVTGSRSTAPMRSDWSKMYKSHILFDKVIAKTKARHIIFSYNNDGFMSKEFIEASLKRYGKSETYQCKKIAYKKYENWKSENKNEHFEYLFYIEKKDASEVKYESPLNYIGSKSKVVHDILKNAPENFSKFIDVFGGGFNVGINFNAQTIIYNDINWFVKDLVESFRTEDTYEYIMYMKKIIKRFRLEKSNTEAYNNFRAYYNSLPQEKKDPRTLFTLILYGYQQQIRFNSKYEFNNPAGMRWFNDKVLEKMISFSRKIKESPYTFKSVNYTELANLIDDNTFVYFDPPYQLTTGSYNDGKRGFNGWNETLENELFSFADSLTAKRRPFMLSYVFEHHGKRNANLERWIFKNNYRIIELGDVLGISGSRRKEVLIVNY